jgi:hypothetical protein
MKYKLAEDAKPQVWLLLVATIITIALWFLPYTEYLVYPIRLFVTFIHESGHALVAVLTGGSVQSLTISADTSGLTYAVPSGFFGALLTSSAGYLGTTVFGVLMLYLIRKRFSPNKILTAEGIFVAVMLVVFTIISPIFNLFTLQVPFSSLLFTIIAGGFLAAALIGLGIYSSPKIVGFAVAFLAVQCLLNALFDLKTVLMINTPVVGSDMANDAANMAAITHIPGFFWVLIWIGISILMISLGLRLYAVNKGRAGSETVFEDQHNGI